MKILIVDDNDVNLKVLTSLLTRHKYDILKASNGLDALALFEQHLPDMVLMDIMMPGMDGRECASRIKQIAEDLYVPIIYVTALNQDAALSTALAAGGDDFVTKPINFDILLSKIKSHQRIQELNNELKRKNHQLAIYNHSLERDQELAAHYFSKIARHNVQIPSIIRHHLSPVSVFNGDVLLTAMRPGGGIYIILGDFTGHGLGASIGSMPVAQIFFNMTRTGSWIGDIARELNRELRELLPDYMFLAATLIEMNSTGERLTVWAGGLPDAYIINPKQKKHQIIKSKYPPFGILSDEAFNPKTDSYSVTEGEKLYLYTDGIIETRNQSDEFYGENRLHSVLTTYEQDVFDRVIHEVNDFIGGTIQSDDTSLVEITCQPLDNNNNDYPQESSRSTTPYRLVIELRDEELKSDTDNVSNISEIICATTLTNHKGFVHTIIAEIYTNMLEHGLLNLDAAKKHDIASFEEYYADKKTALANSHDLSLIFKINFQPDKPKNRLIITATHNGENQIPMTTLCNEQDVEQPGSRGFLLLQNLCDEITIEDNGKTLKVVYLA